VISVLILIITVVSLYGLNQVKVDYQEIIDNSDRTIISLREIQYYFTGQANDERGFLLTGSPEFKNEIQEKSAKVKQIIGKIKPLLGSPREQELLSQLDEAHNNFTGINLQVIDTYNAGKIQEARQLSFNEGRNVRKNLETSFNELIKIQEEQTVAIRSDADAYSNHIKLIVLIIAVLMITMGITFGVLLSGNIVNPITRIIKDMKSGNLNFAELVITNDEVGTLTREFGNMVTKLRQMIVSIQVTAEQVAASSQQLTATAEQAAQASNQVAVAITEVASGAEEQLSSADTARTTVNQMNDSIQQVALKIRDVSGSSNKTVKVANEGLETVETAINQMDRLDKTVNRSSLVVIKLGERSNEIGQIVDTISGIASQTNLLALNAAIEAARAGEQGKGFAIVAEEVRKLAEQSQNAAKQIAVLIGEIQGDTSKAVIAMNQGATEVKTGTEVVTSAGQSFKQIAALVNEVSAQVTDISATIQQLTAGSQEIVASVKQMEDVTQGTVGQTQTVSASTEEQSASMEEISISSQNLAKMAERLKITVQEFKV
jgi:methyl-accepting chemotaxis protein